MQSHRSSKRQKKPIWRKVGKRITGLFEYVPSGMLYAYVSRRGKLYRQSLRTKDLPFAKRKLAEFKNRLDVTDPKFGRVTLTRWLEEIYLPTCKGAESTLSDKRHLVERIKKTWFAARVQPMRDLKPTDIERWLNQQFSEHPSFYNKALMLIRDAFRKAVNDRVLVESPVAALSGRKRARPIRLTPTWEQFKAIIENIRAQKKFNTDAQNSADFLEACGLLGLGQAELAGMRLEHIDLESGRIIVHRRKTDVGFVVPLFPQARMLVERLCAGKTHSQHIFRVLQARKPLRDACKRLGFPQFTHRSLRRMYIVRAIERGVDVKVIAEWQGHRDGGQLILSTYSFVRPIHSQRMATLMSDEQPDNIVPLSKEQQC